MSTQTPTAKVSKHDFFARDLLSSRRKFSDIVVLTLLDFEKSFCLLSTITMKSIRSTRRAKKATPNLPSFKDLPNLLNVIQDEENFNPTAVVSAKSSLKTLLKSTSSVTGLKLPVVKEAIPHLLRVLSDDKYTDFQLMSATLIKHIAKDFPKLAQPLVSSFAVERLIVSQLVHGMKIRFESLSAIGHIASHSKALCAKVLTKHECLDYVLMGYTQSELKSAAAFATYQFCRYESRMVLSPVVLAAINKNGIPNWSGREVSLGSVKSFVLLVNTMTTAEFVTYSKLLKDGVSAIVGNVEIERLGSEYQKEMIRQLLKLIPKKFVVELLFDTKYSQRTFGAFSKVMWSTDRDLQALASHVVALITRYMRLKSKQKNEDYLQSEKALFSPLVKLMSYGGAAQIPAAMACTEMIRYDVSSLAEHIEKSGCIVSLCDVMNTAVKNGTNGRLTDGVMMAYQAILSHKGSFSENFVLSVGIELAKVQAGV